MTKPIGLIEDDEDVAVLGDVEVPARFFNRLSLGVPTLDEMFGGPDMPGLLPGATTLFTGSPGAGKSTMALQLADLLQAKGHAVLYNMGEENRSMVKLRASRLGLRQAFCVSQFANVDRLVAFCRENGVEVLFQDSIQSLRMDDLQGPALLKAVVKRLQVLSKEHDVTMFLVGHVTKSGQFAGPQEIKHDVDAHAHVAIGPDGSRLVELEKNRFGPASVPYAFTLGAQGLDFQQATSPTVEVREGAGGSKSAQRRAELERVATEALLRGERVSGYCFSRLGADCSGGVWRVTVMRAAERLRAEGHDVREAKVDGRTCTYVEPRKEG